MKKRKDIQEQYKWDLTTIYKNIEDWQADVSKCEQEIKSLAKFRGKLNNPTSFFRMLEKETEVDCLADKIHQYVHLWEDEDLSQSKPKELMGVFYAKIINSLQENDFVEEEIKNLPKEYLESLLQDRRFNKYKKNIIYYIRAKNHMLTEKECRVTRLMGPVASGFYNVFESLVDVDLKFQPATDSKGKKHVVTNSNLGLLMESPDRELRINVFKSRRKAFVAVENTLSSNYIAQVKQDWAYAQINNYSSVLESEMYGDNLTEDVYNILMGNIEKYLPLNNRYYKLRKRILGIKDYSSFDDFLPLKHSNKKYTYEQAFGLVKEGLAVLGDDYLKLLDTSVKDRWTDVYPTEGKHGGAYSSGAYLNQPFVLLNFDGTLSDVFTVAHELGHACHTYYSTHNCDACNWDYTTMCAEVASTVNEVLLLKHLYGKAKTKNEKICYLDRYLSEFDGTVFRQALFSMFEDKAHRLVEQNLPISKDVLTETYTKLVAKFGSIKKDKNNRNVGWLRIPHFYSCYYVYKYCLGFTSAVCIASNILAGKEGALENYKKFLKNGGKDFSLDTLKIAGIDLMTNDPYTIAFNEMKWALNELDKLTK